MTWRCRECGRTYHEPPEACVCGSPEVDPDDGRRADDRFSLLAIRQRLLDPGSADRSLVRDEPYVALAFRVLLAAAVLVVVFLVVVVLL